jgi:hypothetical protein
MEKSSQNPSFGQGLELTSILTKAITSAAKKINIDSDRVQTIISKPGLIYQLVEDLFARDGKHKRNSPILRIIPGGENLTIESLNGKTYISNAKKIFKSYIDGNFKNWRLNQASLATAETMVDVREMINDGTSIQLFVSITSDLDRIIMTQAQIIRFCEKYPNWLHQNGYATFFLTKVSGRYFVVSVFMDSIGFYVQVYWLGRDRVWLGEHSCRVVSPKLTFS